jgi:hypothetical protein
MNFQELKKNIPIRNGKIITNCATVDNLISDKYYDDGFIPNNVFFAELELIGFGRYRGGIFAVFMDTKLQMRRYSFDNDIMDIVTTLIYGKTTSMFIYDLDNNNRFYSLKIIKN